MRVGPILQLTTVLIALNDVSSVELSKYGSFQFTCPFNWLNIHWIRHPYPVFQTYWYWYGTTTFRSEGMDLKNRTKVWTYSSWGKHTIRVTLDGRDSDSYWRCCRYYWSFGWIRQCSEWRFSDVKHESNTVYTSNVVPFTPTDSPEISGPFFPNRSLILTSNSENITVGQEMSLSCTIDTEIDEEKWIVIWFQNTTPAFITNMNSSIVIVGNFTDSLGLNESANYDRNIQSFDSILQNMTVAVDELHHNVTFPVPPFLTGWSLWNCANPYLQSISNYLTTEVRDQPTTNPPVTEVLITSVESVTEEDSTVTEDDSTVTEEDSVTTDPLIVSRRTGEESSTTTYIVAGSVGGLVVIVLAVVMVILVLRWRSRKENKSVNSKKEKTSDEIVMEDNVLYAGGADITSQGNIIHLDDERVIEDNVLYEGSQDVYDNRNYVDDEKVVEDNVLYVGSNEGFIA